MSIDVPRRVPWVRRHVGGASDAAVWDALAARYGSQERCERRALSAALRLASPGPQETVVDLATGTGAVLRALACSDARPAIAVGVDRSTRMLARVSALPPGWSTRLGDARDAPLAAAAADVVICSYLLHLLTPETRAAVLAEARRLLRPGPAARLVVITVWADRRRLGGRAVHRALQTLARARPSAWGGLMPLDPTDDLLAAGFQPARRVVLPRGGYPSLVLRAHRSAHSELDRAAASVDGDGELESHEILSTKPPG
jgi:SAM-dependent methyltransferase